MSILTVYTCMSNQHSDALEDTYSRIDYILLSPAMAKVWLPERTYIPTVPYWGMGSDHRPIVAEFAH